MLGRVLVAALVSVPLLAVVAPVATVAQSFAISQIVVEGNERVDAANIAAFADLPSGQTVGPGEINAAAQRVRNSGLFESVDVIPQGNRLIIRVVEYPIVNIINFEGNRRLDDEVLSQVIQSQSRRVYSPTQAEADARAITEAYSESGRFAATVSPRIIRRSDNRVDLVFEIREGSVVEIERLNFVGNRAFSDRRLRGVLETKQAGLLRLFIQRDTFVADRIDLDRQLLRDFYLSRGYIDFQVLSATSELTRDRDAFFVTFTVREGQQFRFGNMSVVSEIPGLDAAEFQPLIRARTGQTYSPTALDNATARMEDHAARKGLTFVRAEPRISRNERTQTLDIEFALVRGERIFVERIDIEGNTTTLDQVIRRQFRTVEGDPFNPREIRQAAERIRALGFFADVDVQGRQGSAGDQVIVDVNVEEQPTGTLGFGVSYGVSQGVGLAVNFSESNFLGRGQFLGVNVNTTEDEEASELRFVEPAFLGRDVAYTFEIYYRQRGQNFLDYSTRNVGLRTGLEFPISERGRLGVTYAVSKDTMRLPSAGLSPILVAETAEGGLWSSGIGLAYDWDSRRSGIEESTFYLFRLGADVTGLGGDTRFLKFSGLGVVETRVLSDDVILRAELEAGAIGAVSGSEPRAIDRFTLNGQMRGFEPFGVGPRDTGTDDALGGQYFAVARFESEFPIGLPEEYGITGGAFVDVGSVWGLPNTDGSGGPGSADDKLRLRATAGLSLFWDTPIGPLRFNFSTPLRKEDYDKRQSFDLTISTRF
jgi:outer membrane protein insertion porin family